MKGISTGSELYGSAAGDCGCPRGHAHGGGLLLSRRNVGRLAGPIRNGGDQARRALRAVLTDQAEQHPDEGPMSSLADDQELRCRRAGQLRYFVGGREKPSSGIVETARAGSLNAAASLVLTGAEFDVVVAAARGFVWLALEGRRTPTQL
jgi:hypothetical protein